MAENFKSGVSRVLNTSDRQISNVVWRSDRPPLDSELNLMGQVGWEHISEMLRSVTHSGWLTDPLRADEDFSFYENSANYFELSGDNLVAIVNGWVIPVKGAKSDDGVANVIELPAPPSTGSLTNVVFLEVWRAVLDGDSSDNRPSDSTIYKHGNVQFTAESLSDEMIDPELGFSTTKRVQVQYRIRVHSETTDLITYTEGLGSPNIYAQGAISAPVEGYTFTNMASEGDAGLYRAGAGDETSQNELGSVDGYVYAIPICAVFRRNSNRYSAVSNGVPNHNGSISRKPSGGSVLLNTPTLTNALTYDTEAPIAISVTNYAGSGLDDPNFFGQVLEGASERFLEMGTGLNREVFSISEDVNLGANEIKIASRGRAGTEPKNHSAGTEIRVLTSRLDGKYADQVTREDVLDLRHVISLGGFDYQSLLQANLSDLLKNNLRTTFKQAGVGSNSYGVEVVEISSLFNPNGATRQHVNFVDAPDGIRTIWSDAPVVQPDVTFLCSLETAIDGNGFTTETIDTETTDTWTIGASFNPQAFYYEGSKLRNGTALFFSIGGANGTTGVRAGIRSDLPDNVVKMISPREMRGRDFDPVKVRFMGYNRPNGNGETGTQGLYTAPSEVDNFETPYIVLGDLVASEVTGISVLKETGDVRNLKFTDSTSTDIPVWAINTGVNLDTLLDTNALQGTTTLRSLITKNGEDYTGFSSEAYVVLHGDLTEITNNGVFKVISAGSESEYLNVLKYAENHSLGTWNAGDDWDFAGALNTESSWVYLIRVGSTQDLFVDSADASLTLEMRTQYLDSRDSSCAIVFTAVEDADGVSSLPSVANRTSGDVLISISLLYPPGHGAMARVLDDVHTIALRNPINRYLRNNTTELDSEGVSTIPLPAQEISFPTDNQISYWSGLDSYGKYASESASYGDTNIAGQINREAEAFYDLGSKSLILRPYRLQKMKAYGHTLTSPSIGNSTYSDGLSKFGGAGIFQVTSNVWEVPHEAMPKFGRQDIPYHRKTGTTDVYMEGYNHLFADQRLTSNGVFKIIGGENTGNGVTPLIFATGGTYGERNTLSGSNLNQSHYGAIKVSISGKPTAEFGDILRGIKLPPHFGIARLYGVYELNDFITNAPDANSSGFEIDRETEVTNGPTNLLRKDNHLYPIHILENGALDETGEIGSHTYVVTENAIDITKAPSYAGESFADMDFVVECCVFGFALGFISENNFVFVRAVGGNGLVVDNGIPITDLPMVIPSAVPQSEEIYIAGTRTPYQGDPFFTIGGSSPSVADSPFRYGQISSANANNFNTPRGQLNEDGTSAIEVANPRTLEVLATLDFYTTLGSGAISTSRTSETGLDLGFAPYTHTTQETAIEARIPASATSSLPQTQVGLFTELEGEGSSVAKCSLLLLSTGISLFTGNNSQHHLVMTYTRGSFTHTFNGESSSSAGLADFVSDIVSDFNGVGISVSYTPSSPTSSAILFFESEVLGTRGNEATLEVSLEPKSGSTATSNHPYIREYTRLVGGVVDTLSSASPKTPCLTHFRGGLTKPVNGGVGKLSPSEVGVTSRLPMGILLSDFDFCCEEPLRNSDMKLNFIAGNVASLDVEVPTDEEGRVYSKSVGAPGELIQMGDGTLLDYTAYPTSANKKFRLSRGGGAIYGASGVNAGAPVTFLNESIPSEMNPILKGAILAGRAMLVRNFQEQAFNVQDLADRSYGDELQLLVVTQGVARSADGTLVLGGSISPSGYGEGFSASDRYRIKGNPLIKGVSRDISVVTPAKK